MASTRLDTTDALNALLDIAKASTKASQQVRDQVKIVRNFGDAISTFGSTVLSTDNSFAKYGLLVDKNIRLANNIAAMHLGSRGFVAFTTATSAIGSLTKSLLEFDDARLKNFDELSKFGISTGMTTEKLSVIINEAGFWSTRSAGFVEAVSKVGTGLLSLGRTTAEGAKKLSEIITLDSVEEFNKLGIGPEKLANFQADYIKLQETTGMKMDKESSTVRRGSYDYIKEIQKLSALTGKRVDEISNEIANAQVDGRLRVMTQKLAEQGNEKAAKIFTNIAGMSKAMFSPKIAAGINDFLANGFPTTDEANALLQLVPGIQDMRQAVIDGKMSTVDFMKAVGKSIDSMESENRSALMYNDVWREKLGLTTETVKNARNLANASSDEELNQQQEAAMKLRTINQDRTEGLKDLQNDQFRAEQKAGIAADKVKTLLSQPMNSAFRLFFDSVRSVAILMLKVSNWIGVGDSKQIQETIDLLQDQSGYKAFVAEYKQQLKTVEEQIKLQEKDSAITKKAADDYKNALAAQEKLRQKMQKGEQVDQKEVETAKTTANEKYKIFKEAEKAEKDKYKGKSGIELEAQRKVILQNLEDREKREKLRNEKSERPVGPSEERKPDTLSNTQYINANLSKFSYLQPNFQKKISGLAEKYYALTGKKLNITSSYRTKEEQLELYNAWRDAGGRYPYEKNPNPTVMTKFGSLSIPSKDPGQHGAGIAVDIDQNQLDWLYQRGLLDEFGLKRHTPIKDDPVHVTPKARKGGVFDGPDSGYNIEMHGREAKIPMQNNKIGIELKDSGVPNNFLNSMSNYAPASSSPVSAPARTNKSMDFVNLLANKIDEMDRKIYESNNIFKDIKVYIRN